MAHRDGRVMIDPVTFPTFEPICTFNLLIYDRLEPDKLTEEEYMICRPILFGFCFGVKMWGMGQLATLLPSPYSPSIVLFQRASPWTAYETLPSPTKLSTP